MIRINQERCIGCGNCVKDCVALNLILEAGKAKEKEECLLCGHCYAVCPAGAVEMPAEYDVKDVEDCQYERPALDPKQLLAAIKSRRSIRDYQNRPVEQEKLEMLLQAGRYTATAKNNQDCHFVFVQEGRDALKQMVWDFIDARLKDCRGEIPESLLPYASFNSRRKADANDDYLFRNAPVIAFVASRWPLDAGLAAQNIELMAVSQGLGALYNGFLARITEENTQAKEWLGIPDHPIKACLLLGYPNIQYSRTVPRKPGNVVWR